MPASLSPACPSLLFRRSNRSRGGRHLDRWRSFHQARCGTGRSVKKLRLGDPGLGRTAGLAITSENRARSTPPRTAPTSRRAPQRSRGGRAGAASGPGGPPVAALKSPVMACGSHGEPGGGSERRAWRTPGHDQGSACVRGGAVVRLSPWLVLLLFKLAMIRREGPEGVRDAVQVYSFAATSAKPVRRATAMMV